MNILGVALAIIMFVYPDVCPERHEPPVWLQDGTVPIVENIHPAVYVAEYETEDNGGGAVEECPAHLAGEACTTYQIYVLHPEVGAALAYAEWYATLPPDMVTLLPVP